MSKVIAITHMSDGAIHSELVALIKESTPPLPIIINKLEQMANEHTKFKLGEQYNDNMFQVLYQYSSGVYHKGLGWNHEGVIIIMDAMEVI